MAKQLTTGIDFTSLSKKSQHLLKQFTCLQQDLHIPLLTLTSASEWIGQQTAKSLDNKIHQITLNGAIATLEAQITAEMVTIRELQKLSSDFKQRIDQDSPLEQSATMQKNIDGIQQKLGRMPSEDLQINLDALLLKLEEIEGVQDKR